MMSSPYFSTGGDEIVSRLLDQLRPVDVLTSSSLRRRTTLATSKISLPLPRCSPRTLPWTNCFPSLSRACTISSEQPARRQSCGRRRAARLRSNGPASADLLSRFPTLQMALNRDVKLGNDTIVTVWISSANVRAVAEKRYRIIHAVCLPRSVTLYSAI